MTVDRKIDAFESTLQASRDWVLQYAAELGQDHPELAFRCLRAGLHALRDRLTVEEAVALAAQLPMLLRGAYFEGYRPAHVPLRIHTPEELYQHVAKELSGGLAAPAHDVVRALFALLDKRIDAGEVRKVRHLLPEALRRIWPEPQPRAAAQPRA